MIIRKYFEKQKQLDDFIMEFVKRRGEVIKPHELLAYRLLALITERGEMADADRENSIKEYVDIWHFLLSVGDLVGVKRPYETTEFKCMYEKLRLNIKTNYTEISESFLISFSKFANITRSFKYWSIKKNCSDDELNSAYIDMFLNFIYLGHVLGFTAEEIEIEYVRKNEENYQRQNEGY